MKPCPCGYHGDPDHDCFCSDAQVASYRRKISGPLLDRIDLHVTVPRVAVHVLDKSEPAESSNAVAMRVMAARQRQAMRSDLNAQLPPRDLVRQSECDDAAAALLKEASKAFALSARSQHKVLRVARTVADLARGQRVERRHMAEALGLCGQGTGVSARH